ncbi:c-type cytochrome [Caldimonas tepidiphila]|uniref:c-type cytochrome n=1 Tax=Caldimonas tepidiphila TaxID=2315841 RepID=UPI000E5A104E|nr:c-type cytochrome [Caldimonas tepidiphila]
MRKTLAAPALALLFAVAAPAHADARDDQMVKLAATSGCTACHGIETGRPGPGGAKPIGPAWRDVSVKYRGDANALAALTETVMRGSSPYESHWKGEVSGLSMPPNAVAIRREDAQQLVQWILGLAK